MAAAAAAATTTTDVAHSGDGSRTGGIQTVIAPDRWRAGEAIGSD